MTKNGEQALKGPRRVIFEQTSGISSHSRDSHVLKLPQDSNENQNYNDVPLDGISLSYSNSLVFDKRAMMDLSKKTSSSLNRTDSKNQILLNLRHANSRNTGLMRIQTEKTSNLQTLQMSNQKLRNSTQKTSKHTTMSAMDKVRISQQTLLSSKSIHEDSMEAPVEVRLKNEHIQSLLDQIQEQTQPNELELMESTYGKDAAAQIMSNSLFTTD